MTGMQVPSTSRPDRLFRDSSDAANWPATIALLGMDLLQPHLAVLGLASFSKTEVKERSREFIRQWRRLDGSKYPEYVDALERLIRAYLRDIQSDGLILDRLVHDAYRLRNEFGILNQWIAALCQLGRGSGGDQPRISAAVASTFVEVVRGWCAEATRANAALSVLDSSQAQSEWDRWLCSEGFYGDDEFLAAVMAQRIVAWWTVETLRERLRSLLSDTDLRKVLEWARTRVPTDQQSPYITLEL